MWENSVFVDLYSSNTNPSTPLCVQNCWNMYFPPTSVLFVVTVSLLVFAYNKGCTVLVNGVHAACIRP